MTSMKTTLPLLLVAISSATTAAQAQVCGEPYSEPFNYFTFAEPSPAPDATEVPLDAALILRGDGYGIGGSPIIFSWFVLDSVIVTDAAGHEVPGRIVATEVSPTVPAVSWMPTEPFAAETEYRVAATLAEQDFRPEDAEGSETLEFQFTTGTTNTPALTVDAALTATIATAPRPIYDCASECDCTEVGTYDGLVAHVTIPAIHGGTDAEGYRARVFLSDAEAITFDESGRIDDADHEVYEVKSLFLTPGTEQEIELQLPANGQPYVPCFALDVRDPARRHVSATPICLDEVDPPAAPEPIVDGQGGAGGTGNTDVHAGGKANPDIRTGEGGSGNGEGGSGNANTGSDEGGSGNADTGSDEGGSSNAGRGNEAEGGEKPQTDVPSDNAASDSGSNSSGCSVAAPTGSSPAPWLGLSLLGLVAFARRRRQA